MKKMLVVVFLLSFATMAICQSQPTGQAGKKENQVANAVQELKKAMVDGDSLALLRLSSSRLTYGHSSGNIETQAQFVGNITNRNSDFVTIDLSEQTISVIGKTAIVRHTFIAAISDKGKAATTVKLHILTVWIKSGGWKMVARQAVRIP